MRFEKHSAFGFLTGSLIVTLMGSYVGVVSILFGLIWCVALSIVWGFVMGGMK